MFGDITKTEIENKLKQSNAKRELLQEQVQVMELQLKEIRDKLLGVKKKQ